ncbi:23S rRNA pseudouridine2605 synthase [Roseiarcus fermentans]|uniref:Pseudouridine synthase n=1 Tax=Roseiarcus fermentans TaxID=1473586 RepID=A0A366EK83_9HYPH|nr:pseudouridine synthase [Roseiarcus fermentans]RBP02832.1 23S rRNA pseudouridine2605 synthase [Roseiarcus fermentans]
MSDEDKSEVREGSRIAKVMARAGLCSRREAETWIAEGRVSVNGKVLDSPAYNVSDQDEVRVDGERLGAAERTRLFLFHKPRGLVTTSRDPEGRRTIFDALPPDLPRVVAIGRLDINTEGLLLLTNDGGLARVLELPATGWLRRYRVRAHGAVDQAQLDALRDGVTVDGIDYAGIEAKLDREQGSNAWITMGLREGKNREIKRVLEHLGLSVNRLIRVSFGPFELGDLAEGEVAEVRTRVLRDQLGAKLAREAGVDFDAPVADHAPAPAPAPESPREERRKRPDDAGRSRKPAFARDREREEAPPRRAPPAPSTPERKRKHVSALRAEIARDATDEAAPRKRIARSATQDRKGRTVAVERISKAGADVEAPASETRARKAGPRRERGASDGERRPRDGRREAAAPGAARPRRAGPDGERSPPARGEGRARPPRDAGEAGRPARSFRPDAPRGRPAGSGGRPEGGASAPGAARRPWKDGERSPPRGGKFEGEGRGRPPRGEGEAGKPARSFREGPRERPPAARGGKFEGERARPPRGEGEAGKPARSFRPEGSRERPPRGEGGTGKPARSFRSDAPRGRPEGDKPRGAPGGRSGPGAGPGRPPGKR